MENGATTDEEITDEEIEEIVCSDILYEKQIISYEENDANDNKCDNYQNKPGENYNYQYNTTEGNYSKSTCELTSKNVDKCPVDSPKNQDEIIKVKLLTDHEIISSKSSNSIGLVGLGERNYFSEKAKDSVATVSNSKCLMQKCGGGDLNLENVLCELEEKISHSNLKNENAKVVLEHEYHKNRLSKLASKSFNILIDFVQMLTNWCVHYFARNTEVVPYKEIAVLGSLQFSIINLPNCSLNETLPCLRLFTIPFIHICFAHWVFYNCLKNAHSPPITLMWNLLMSRLEMAFDVDLIQECNSTNWIRILQAHILLALVRIPVAVSDWINSVEESE